ncbi:MAG: (d)CMP kinase [Bacilli bacterium]|nr:(d)CMP kinase [Bacilli bacterium]
MFKIAIDGPAGSGKSTISKLLSSKLNFEHIDTGAMYRAITLKALKLGINLENEDEYDFLDDTIIELDHDKIFLDGVDVSKEIRSVEVTTNASTPAKLGRVRTCLVDLQRKIAASKNVIMDGRDIGTVVLPNADLKIYLDASCECRAERRRLERSLAGVEKSFEETLQEIIVRDHKDSTRAISPLKVADDAIVIDSSNLTIEEVINKIIGLVNERVNKSMSEKVITFTEGQEVVGTIINVSKEAIYIELEGENKAVIYDNDMAGYVEGQKLRDYYFEGGEFKGLVKQITKDNRSNKPLYILSTKLYKAREEIKVFDELKEKDEIIKAKVIHVSNAGCDLLYKGHDDIKVFLPAKNIYLNEKALHSLRGEMIDVVVTNVDHEQIKVIVSHSAAQSKIRKAAKEAAYNALQVGDVVEGVVDSVTDFGAFVKLGELTGLLHRSELDHKLVRNVSDQVKVGQNITVKVIKLEEGKIGLSVRALTPHPWDVLKEQYHVGDVFEGTVVKIINAGLIIKLTEEYSGLMPNVEFSWRTNERIEGNVNEGDTIKVQVMAIDNNKKKVSLSHRATVENLWANINIKPGTVINVEIAAIQEKGAVVNYETISGFLPVNEVTDAKRIGKVDEVYPVGTKVDAIVLECDPGRAKLVVSVKKLENQKERAEFDRFLEKQESETPSTTLADLLGESLKKFSE